jgi:hypothetical protein
LLPSFFIVGPPRTGTTWLYEILRHRAILPKSTKETRFFDTHFHRGLHWYQAHYPSSNGAQAVGEVAPTYFASRQACHRIKELIPTAKIVCIFRNPVERLISLYRVKRAYGFIPWNFEEALLRDAELVESGRFATHLRAWQQAFGSDQVSTTFFDDLRDDPQHYVHALADFIGIPRFTLTTQELREIYTSETMTHPRSYYRTHRASLVADWLKARRWGRFVSMINSSPIRNLFLGGGARFAQPTQELSQSIFELFCSEIEQLETMVNRDLSGWRPSSITQVHSSSS